MAAHVKVKALVDCMDNGIKHKPGEEFEMEYSLVKPHVEAGQVEVVAGKVDAAPAAPKTGGKKK